jgi:Uma2 family endonuclease
MSTSAALEIHPRATLADVLAYPEGTNVELIDGVLHVMPRPAPRHARASSVVGAELLGPFDRGRGGPGGWWILDEPELHFPHPTIPGDTEVLIPDVAGWRRERMPKLPKTAAFHLAPDWICEVISTSTEDVDRDEKMPIYAREGVKHAWLVTPVERTLELYVLGKRRRWSKPTLYRGDALVRAAPFEAIELELAALWTDE